MSLDPRWEEIFKTRGWGKYPPEEFVRFLARHYYGVDPREAVHVFEVGFGVGANLWYAAREGFTVHGLEGSVAGRDLACARLDAEVPQWRQRGGELRAGDMCRPLPWPDADFDLGIDSNAVSCVGVDQARAVYRELHRVVRPGGRLFVRTLAVGTWGEGTGRALPGGLWECAEGPCAGVGPVRFTRADELDDLLGPWMIEGVEEVSRTLENRRHVVREWVVGAVKSQAD